MAHEKKNSSNGGKEVDFIKSGNAGKRISIVKKPNKNYELQENKNYFKSYEYSVEVACDGSDGFYGSLDKQEEARKIIQEVIKAISLEDLEGDFYFRWNIDTDHIDTNSRIPFKDTDGSFTHVYQQSQISNGPLPHLESTKGMLDGFSQEEIKNLPMSDLEKGMRNLTGSEEHNECYATINYLRAEVKNLKFYNKILSILLAIFVIFFFIITSMVIFTDIDKPTQKPYDPVLPKVENSFNQETFDKIKADEFKKEWDKDRGVK